MFSIRGHHAALTRRLSHHFSSDLDTLSMDTLDTESNTEVKDANLPWSSHLRVLHILYLAGTRRGLCVRNVRVIMIS